MSTLFLLLLRAQGEGARVSRYLCHRIAENSSACALVKLTTCASKGLGSHQRGWLVRLREERLSFQYLGTCHWLPTGMRWLWPQMCKYCTALTARLARQTEDCARPASLPPSDGGGEVSLHATASTPTEDILSRWQPEGSLHTAEAAFVSPRRSRQLVRILAPNFLSEIGSKVSCTTCSIPSLSDCCHIASCWARL